MESNTFNIVELIEKNPLTRLSSDYNIKFLIKHFCKSTFVKVPQTPRM